MSEIIATSSLERGTLSERVAGGIRTQIFQGSLQPGDRLPAEPELAAEFEVSRATVRSAVTELVTELLLEKRRGIGTFVREGTGGPSYGFERLIGLTEAIRSVGSTPSIEGLSVDRVVAEEDLHEAYGIDIDAALWRIERTWLVDGKPAVHGVDWVPTDVLGLGATLEDFAAGESLSDRLGRLGIRIAAAMSRIHPDVAGESVGAHLSLPPASPILLIRQVHYDDRPTSRPVLYSDQFWGGHALGLHIVRRTVT